jgi:nucleotide-binding universal stress UspA family protein
MKEFKKILFPVDLSESSAKIAPYALMVANKFKAEIHLLFVARELDYFTGIYVPPVSVSGFQKEIIEGAEKRLDEFLDQHFKESSDAGGSVVSGDASSEIVKYAEANGIDLIIMGTHGRKGLNEVVFGSVSDRVVKTAPVPVMVVNPHRVTS